MHLVIQEICHGCLIAQTCLHTPRSKVVLQVQLIPWVNVWKNVPAMSERIQQGIMNDPRDGRGYWCETTEEAASGPLELEEVVGSGT